MGYFTIRSIECPKCSGDIWERNWDYVNSEDDPDFTPEKRHYFKCTNCGHEREYTPRKPRTDSITPSQKKAMAKIRQYFDRYAGENSETMDEVKMTHGGKVSFTYVVDRNHFWAQSGAHFIIGRKGRIDVGCAYDYGSSKEKQKHYAAMLGGHVL